MYHKELVDQQARVTKLEQDISNKNADLDENAEYILKQEVCWLGPSLFPPPRPLSHPFSSPFFCSHCDPF